APERNGTVGGIVLQKFRELRYPELYRDDKGKEGWYTSASAKPPKIDRYNMLKQYEEAIRLRATVVRSFEAIGEMSTFIRSDGGKYKALSGRMDDRVLARAITWQIRSTKPRGTFGFGSYKRLASSYS
ncbi:hypothetical protein LCGC14_2946930, partial [marine sediment metagenome]